MLSQIHDRLGTAGLIVAVVALVVALAGTAIAAAGLNSTQKKEVKKIAQKFAGKPGATGATGPAGAPGPKGDTGAAGKDGTNGTPGAPGTPGAAGKSVITEEVLAGETDCNKLGGSKFHTQGSVTNTFACNGETGFTETLPIGKTETGSLAFLAGATGTLGIVALPFNIPLSNAPEATIYNLPGTDCPGTIAEPKAAPGKLCIYVEGQIFNATSEPEGVGRTTAFDRRYRAGATLTFVSHGANKAILGTYAVTAK